MVYSDRQIGKGNHKKNEIKVRKFHHIGRMGKSIRKKKNQENLSLVYHALWPCLIKRKVYDKAGFPIRQAGQRKNYEAGYREGHPL